MSALGAGVLARAMHSCDAGIFLSRAEGGSNLMAMEALAVGLPLLLSNNTGHTDIISVDWAFPMRYVSEKETKVSSIAIFEQH